MLDVRVTDAMRYEIMNARHEAFEEMVRTLRRDKEIMKYARITYNGDHSRGIITIECKEASREKRVFKTLLTDLMKYV